jgi:ubiquinone/menaquinone biosynthesis C-methylase UbiE
LKKEITHYYNTLAKEYDHSRFSNTYGAYIHQQEVRILNNYLDQKNTHLNLDLACGTGRFLNYADYGIDVSQEMLKIAQSKFPAAKLTLGSATALPYEDNSFQHVLSFHLMMHLDHPQLKQILSEVHRVTRPNGYFIFDMPSEKRRKLTSYHSDSWHGGNQITSRSLKEISSNGWNLIAYHGVSFFPIHRIPKSFRKRLIAIDNYLSNSFLKEYSSYLVFILQKK